VAELGLRIAVGGGGRAVAVGTAGARPAVLVRVADVGAALIVRRAGVHEPLAPNAVLHSGVRRRPRTPAVTRLALWCARQNVVLHAGRRARRTPADGLGGVVAADALLAARGPAGRGAPLAAARSRGVGAGPLAAACTTRRVAGGAAALARRGVDAGDAGRAAARTAGRCAGGTGGVGAEGLQEHSADRAPDAGTDGLEGRAPTATSRKRPREFVESTVCHCVLPAVTPHFLLSTPDRGKVLA
jgi:hypothetical protein